MRPQDTFAALSKEPATPNAVATPRFGEPALAFFSFRVANRLQTGYRAYCLNSVHALDGEGRSDKEIKFKSNAEFHCSSGKRPCHLDGSYKIVIDCCNCPLTDISVSATGNKSLYNSFDDGSSITVTACRGHILCTAAVVSTGGGI